MPVADQVHIFPICLSVIVDHLVMEGFTKSIGVIAEITFEGIRQRVAFSLEYQSFALVLNQASTYG